MGVWFSRRGHAVPGAPLQPRTAQKNCRQDYSFENNREFSLRAEQR